MPVEKANYISDLVPTNPQLGDNIADGPDHFWLIKKAIQNTFPNIKGAITASQDQLNTLTGLVGDSTSDGMDLKGNLTVEGNLTVSDGVDLKGSLTVSDGVDLKGSLTVGGETLVPSVTDWTKKQAVPASDADARYVQPAMLPFTDSKLRFQIIRADNPFDGGIQLPQAFSGPPVFVSVCRALDGFDYGDTNFHQVYIAYYEGGSDKESIMFACMDKYNDFADPGMLYIMVGGYF